MFHPGLGGIPMMSRDCRYQVTEPGEEGPLPLAHEVKVERLLAEVALGGRGAGPRRHAHLPPRLQQSLCGEQQASVEPAQLRGAIRTHQAYQRSGASFGECGVG